MVLIAFFSLVLVLIAVSAILGFATALYLRRPSLFGQLVEPSDEGVLLILKAGVGLAIAIFTPLVAGLSYALSGASWMVAFLGEAGVWFWAWAGLTWLAGLFMGCMLHHGPSRDSDESITRIS
jgi:hypothetical protein